MDPISQGALGAVAAMAVAAPQRVRLAALVGWAGGTAADADIFIRSATDPLLNIEYHRHFTHSLVFIPIGGLICAAVLWWFVRRRLSFRATYLYSIAGYATAGLLDACTSYGTQLWWPFSDLRVSWNIISIVDPIFTLPLLALLVVAGVRRRPGWARGAAVFALAYLGLGMFQRERASDVQAILATERGHHAISRPTVKPSLGNLILWRSIYVYEDRYYIDAIRLGVVGEPIVYPGTSVAVFDHEAAVAVLPPGSVLGNDLRRFAHFSEGYVAELPDRPGFLTDVRYSPLPNSIDPLWGIDVKSRGPADHVAWIDREDHDFAPFLRMLRGEPADTGTSGP